MPRNLSQGASGQDVRAVQQGLNLRAPSDSTPLVADGAFGPRTDAAVRNFQQANGLDADGIVGPLTRVKLFPLATATVRLFGMRLRLPEFRPPRTPFRPNLLPGQLTLGDPSQPPSLRPLVLPPLNPPLLPYAPQRYPLLQMPIATPPLAPPSVPNLTLPVDHFELAPGSTISLFDRNRRLDAAFGLTLSGIVMIGDEKATHNEFSSGIAVSTPNLVQGGDWTVSWFAQITHVHQLNRAGNFSWQPNAQVATGSMPSPFLGLTLSPFNVQFDATDTLSVSFGGPSATATALFNPTAGSLSWSFASFGLVAKFN